MPQHPVHAPEHLRDVTRARQALVRHDFAAADALCRRILAVAPHHPQALELLGLALAHRGQLTEAEPLLRRAVDLSPSSHALANHATVLNALGRYSDAIADCDRAAHLEPRSARVALIRARALVALGRLHEAVIAYDSVVSAQADMSAAWLERGNAQTALGRHDDALASYDRAVALKASADALNCRGGALSALGRFQDALESFDAALREQPRFFAALNNRAGALRELGRLSEALTAYDTASVMDPMSADCWCNKGAVLATLGRHRDALACFDRALSLRPQFPEALNSRGASLVQMGAVAEALATYTRALELAPRNADLLHNRGVALMALKRHEEAIEDLRAALEARERPLTRGMLLSARLHCCDWHDLGADTERILRHVRAGEWAIDPFSMLALPALPHDQLVCARTSTQARHPSPVKALWRGERYRHERIRIAYVSANFGDHPLAHLMTGLFERHDRTRFETYAVDIGRPDGSVYRDRLVRAFDHFIELHGCEDLQIAARLRELEIDILIDRNGYTSGGRPGVFASRPAPIQVSYVAFPGTSGASWFDYLVADSTVIPPDEQRWYSECVVYLPHCYLPTDNRRRIAADLPTRADYGIPDDAFVFCCFNNAYKITPAIFDVWMSLLHDVEGSVLWLLDINTALRGNLRRKARQRGIDSNRLLFAARVSNDQHLARHCLADLFLDTLPYNAHTTAVDSLWAGLPVVTQTGSTFAGRVTASLLNALDCPELTTSSAREYRDLAYALATEPDRLDQVRAKVRAKRYTAPAFDTDLLRGHLERAYVEMWRRYQAGLAPAPFSVPADAH